MFHATVAILLGSDFFLLLFLYLRYASPFARVDTSLTLLRSTPLLIGCRPLLSLISPSLTLTVSFSPALFSLPPRVVFSLLPPFLVLCHTCLGGFPTPSLSSSLLGVGCPCSSSVYLLPLAPSSFLTSPSPCFDLVSFPSLYPPLLSPKLPPLVDFFLLGFSLIPGWGVGSTTAFGGVPSTPHFPIRDCRLRLFCTDTCCLLLPPPSTHPHAWVAA